MYEAAPVPLSNLSSMQGSRQSRPVSAGHSSRLSVGSPSSAPEEMLSAEETEAERTELLALRKQLRERERRLNVREQHLQSKEANIQVCFS